MTTRSPGSRWRETAVLAIAFALCLAGAVMRVDGTLSPPPAVGYLIAVSSCAALSARRRAPLAVLVITVACCVPAQPLGLLLSPVIAAPALIATFHYSLTASTERRAGSAVSLASAALLIAAIPWPDDLSWQDVSRIVMTAAFPVLASALGLSVRNRRAYLAAVEERALQAERSRDSEARRRVADERVRIARELHDLVAHQITLANAQATVAAHLFGTNPAQTRTSLNELVETTAHALDDLRAAVGLLRQSEDATTLTEPAPGLSQLPVLLESFRRAGLEVSVRQEGTARPLPPGMDLTAHRIVQEALTNVTKHAGSDTAEVRLHWMVDGVAITVVDSGGQAPQTAIRSTGPARTPGFGLIGMRERTTAVGGSFAAGQRPEGGFVVSARLPLPPVKDPVS